MAAWQFIRRPYLAVGWLWWLGALVPVIGIIQVGTQARADRYTYLPMIGVYLMVAWLLKEVADRWPLRRPLLAGGAAVVLAALSAATFVQVGYWINSYKLFFHSVGATDADDEVKTEHRARLVEHAGGDRQYFGYDSAGKVDLEKTNVVTESTKQLFRLQPHRHRFDKDGKEKSKSEPLLAQILFDHSAAAFAATLAIKPDYDFGNNNLGVYYARGGKSHDAVQAERFFRKAITVNSRYADAFNNLGIVLAEQGRDLERQGQLRRGPRQAGRLGPGARQRPRRAARQGLRPQQPLRRLAGNGQSPQGGGREGSPRPQHGQSGRRRQISGPRPGQGHEGRRRGQKLRPQLRRRLAKPHCDPSRAEQAGRHLGVLRADHRNRSHARRRARRWRP